MTRKRIKSSYGSVHRTLTYDIEIRPWKIARSQKMNATQRYGRVKSAKKLLQKFGTKPTRSN
jgi:hypothetical protein